jgi:PAS domain S-box-containing protein
LIDESMAGDEVSTEQKRLKDLNTRLLDLVHGISLADEFNTALSMLLEQASDLVPCDGISVMLLTGDHLDVLGSRGSTAPMVGLTLPGSQMGAGRVVLDGSRVVVVADTEEDRRWQRVPGEEQVRSWLGAPLPVEGRTIGLLTWSAKTPERFDRDDAELAGQIAGNVAPLLHRAQVLDDTRSRLREMVEPRLDATQRGTDLSTELQPIVREALDFAQARHAFAFVRGEASRRLRCVAASGEQRDRLVQTTLRGDGTLGGWSVPMKGSSDWLGAGPSDREVMVALGIERTLILPLRAGGNEVGMLGVAEPRRGRAFGRDAMRLMTQLASQASLTVERVSPASQGRKQYDYETVIQSAPLGIGVLTVTGEIRVANPALAGQLSRSNRNLVGHNLSEFLLSKDARRLENVLEEVAVTGQRRYLEAGIQVVSGDHRYVRISLAPAHISSDAGGNLVAMVEDVTALKILEEERVGHLKELREKHDQLKDLDELKSRFVSNVSHELRTPLAVIKLYATLARKGRPEKQTHYLQTIEQETHRLETMVENILDLSRMDRQALRVHPEWMEPEEVIDRVLEVYEEAVQKRGVELRDQVQEDLPLLWADKNHLIQMLTNLLDNALKYTPQGGQIWVAAREIEAASGRMLEVAVGDTGAGVPADEQERVFERFYRGSNNTPGQTGTGLGLAIVQELMLRHGGRVTLESKVGEGSVFTLQFPLYDEDHPPEGLNGSNDV